MTLPSQFERELQDRFHGKFRLRWSDKEQRFHLEQKVATGQILPPPVEDGVYDTYDDKWIRASQGYFFVMSIEPGDRMACPVCHQTVKVPLLHTGEAICENCVFHGLKGHVKAAFFPLNHTLIAHLADIDPANGGPERARKRMRASQLAKLERDKKEQFDAAGEAIMDDKYQVEQRPMVGYGPKTAQRNDHTRFL